MKMFDRIARRFGFHRPRAQARNFAGANLGRLLSDWIRAPLSGDRELDGSLLQLRARSRDAVRNNPFARRYLKLAQNHIVGPKGIRMRPCNVIGGRPHDRLNDEIVRGWLEWGKPTHASTDGRLSWVGLQRLAVAERAQSGEALFQIVYDTAHPFGLSLLPIDADRLDERLNTPAVEGRNEIRYGIEVDRIGRPLAYHILSEHPSETGRIAKRPRHHDVIPAAQIIHWLRGDERVGRTRGVPDLAIALRDLRHLDGAQEASLVALRTAASSVAVVVSKDPNGEIETPDQDAVIEVEPGQWRYLGPNQELQSWTPHAPADNYPDFTKSVLRGTASALGTSYAVLAGDWSDANMSSLRVARADEQENWMAEQEAMIEHFCQRVFDAWLPAAALAGGIRIPSFDLTRAAAVQWQPRKWLSPKPSEDIEADERRVALGVTSRTAVAARDGVDLWEVWDQLAEEQEYAAEKHLNVEPPRKVSGPTGAPKEDDDDTTPAPDTTDGAASGDGSDAGDTGRGRDGRRVDPDRHQLRIARTAL